MNCPDCTETDICPVCTDRLLDEFAADVAAVLAQESGEWPDEQSDPLERWCA
jgi:hypothetical protein